MQVSEAQADVRRSFVGGGPGVIGSGLVWCAAAIAEMKAGVGVGFAVLFLGGMLIFPLSLMTARAVFRRARPQSGNGLIPIALESTAAMIAGLLAAYLFLAHAPSLVFPVSALAVGTHYFAFRTLYGDAIFLLLGGGIAALGLNAIFDWILLPGGLLWWVAAVEFVFGVILTARSMRS
jgi:hypothetical protein